MEDKQFVLDISQSQTEYYKHIHTTLYKFFSDKIPDYSNNVFLLHDDDRQYRLVLGLYFDKYKDMEEYDTDSLYSAQVTIVWKDLNESIFFLDACVLKINWGRHRIDFVDTSVFKSSMDKEEYDGLIKSIKYLQEHLSDIETVLVNIKEIIIDDGED